MPHPLPSRRLLKPAQLRLLEEIGETRQLGRAADACAMTQPAASRMLAEIERLLDARLFLRQPTGMEPTETGRVVLARARAILREMRGMAQDVTALNQGGAGSVRIGAVTGPAVGTLVAAVRAIKQRSPAANITIDVMPSRDLLTHLDAGEMDFVLGRILPDFESRAYDVHPMGDEEVAMLVRGAHPLARAQAVTLTQLFDHEWIMQQRGAPIREATMQAFAAVGLGEPANIISTSSLVFTIAYLAQGDAVAPTSREVAQLLVRPPVGAGFVTLSLARDVRVPPYYLLSLRRRPLSPLAQRLREQVIACAGDPRGDWGDGLPRPGR